MLFILSKVGNIMVFKHFSLSRNPTSGGQLLVLVVTMVAMDKVMRLMVAVMHNLKTLTCMVMELMQGTPITSNQQRRSSHHNSR
jgi:hypothetical protein